MPNSIGDTPPAKIGQPVRLDAPDKGVGADLSHFLGIGEADLPAAPAPFRQDAADGRRPKTALLDIGWSLSGCLVPVSVTASGQRVKSRRRARPISAMFTYIFRIRISEHLGRRTITANRNGCMRTRGVPCGSV